ncbi:hypothetical protein [Bdellovibrio sp. HCB2-146]|uniref:hypothetical protein n=1 Tax=Bdellovibrio sp. HCB2-146 TaxID=3394362 RepID=UPI0039BD4375
MRAQTMNGLIAVISASLVLASCGFKSGLQAASSSQAHYGAAEKFQQVDVSAPIISEFAAVTAPPNGVVLEWKTDIPSTSQVKLVSNESGDVIQTKTDNTLRTHHSVKVMGLALGHSYAAQVVSVSEDLGYSLSDIIEVNAR